MPGDPIGNLIVFVIGYGIAFPIKNLFRSIFERERYLDPFLIGIMLLCCTCYSKDDNGSENQNSKDV